MSQAADAPILSWTEEVIGSSLLAYLLACDMSAVDDFKSGIGSLTDEQVAVLAGIEAARQAIPAPLDDDGRRKIIRQWLTQPGPDDEVSVARSFHEYAGGEVVVPGPGDEAEVAIAALAIDIYPGFLVPSDEPGTLFYDEYPYVRRRLRGHPRSLAFCRAALEDPTLGKAFEHGNDELDKFFDPMDKYSSRIAMIFRNTSGGSSIQLSLFPGLLIDTVWQRCRDGSPSPAAFASAAIKHLALVRSVLRHEPHEAVALLAFTGVLLPPGRMLELSDALVRPLKEKERRRPRHAAEHPITGYEPRQWQRRTDDDGSGRPVVINLDGDLVLEYKFAYKVRLGNPGSSQGFPEDMYPPEAIDQAATRLRFSLLMAAERAWRVLIFQTWRQYVEPLPIGLSVPWNDPRNANWLAPTQLTEAETDAWCEWYERLKSPRVAKIDLALTRILRACAERRDPADVLVDAVIAWENLFGTKDGEPTFRITASLAVLLRNSRQERLALRKRLTAIYALRSKVVHGSGSLTRRDYPLCYEALDLAISAVRTLILERSDILELADGGERSAHLLLQNSAATEAGEDGGV